MRPLIRIAAFAGAVLVTLGACRRADPLLQPRPARVAEAGPDSFLVRFETSRGPFVMKIRRAWSPAGADRVHYLVGNRFYDGARFFRVVPNFVVQFGIPADPAVSAAWYQNFIPDDPVRASNTRGTVSFARAGRETRSTQLFVNLRDNARLDTLNGFGFPPIGEVIEGMAAVDSLYSGYRNVDQDSIRLQGNAYLTRVYPRLDSIITARITTRWGRR